MHKTPGSNPIFLASIGLLAGIALILSGCQMRPEMPVFQGVLTQSAPIGEVALVQENDPAAEPVAVVDAEAIEVNECLECHRDKDLLIETAKPEEPEAESESKGVG